MPLTWLTLSRDLSETISRFLDKRFRFLEPLLLRICQSQNGDSLHPPSDEALAEALRCDVGKLQEYRAAFQTDLGHLLHLLIPVVAYFGDVGLARRLQSDAELGREQFDVLVWLRSSFPLLSGFTPDDLISACEQASNRASLRIALNLDYERFNRMLLEMGESPLSNEDELRSMYEAYLKPMKLRILERLRRHHAIDFREGRDLKVYAARRSLTFLKFDPSWILTRETSENEVVEAHVAKLLDEILGQDQEINLPSYRGTFDKNSKSIREFSSRAMPVVEAWCRHNVIAVPARGKMRICRPWQASLKTRDC